MEAVQQLGQQLGIPVELSGGNESSGFFDNMYKINDSASTLYHKTLFTERGQRALKYLMDRGLSRESIEFFKVGFAPESSKFLLNSINWQAEQMPLLLNGILGLWFDIVHFLQNTISLGRLYFFKTFFLIIFFWFA